MKLLTPPQWSQPDDLYYIAALIDQLESPFGCLWEDGSEFLSEKDSDFTRRLILLNAGLLPTDTAALPDFIDNFKQLYPHLFQSCPRWVHWLRDESFRNV